MKSKHLIIYLFVWIAYFSMLFLTSCKTKTVTQEHYITDNTVSKGLDASWQERFISAFEQMANSRTQEHETSVRETTHTKDSTSTTVDQNGKPIKTESWHSVVTNRDTKEVLRLKDSINIISKKVDKYQHLVVQKDSLIRLKQDSINIMRRELTKNEQRLVTIGKVSLGALAGIIIAIIGILVWLWFPICIFFSSCCSLSSSGLSHLFLSAPVCVICYFIPYHHTPNIPYILLTKT